MRGDTAGSEGDTSDSWRVSGSTVGPKEGPLSASDRSSPSRLDAATGPASTAVDLPTSGRVSTGFVEREERSSGLEPGTWSEVVTDDGTAAGGGEPDGELSKLPVRVDAGEYCT